MVRAVLSRLSNSRCTPAADVEQQRTHSGERLHSNYGEAAWNDRHGRDPVVQRLEVDSLHGTPRTGRHRTLSRWLNQPACQPDASGCRCIWTGSGLDLDWTGSMTVHIVAAAVGPSSSCTLCFLRASAANARAFLTDLRKGCSPIGDEDGAVPDGRRNHGSRACLVGPRGERATRIAALGHRPENRLENYGGPVTASPGRRPPLLTRPRLLVRAILFSPLAPFIV